MTYCEPHKGHRRSIRLKTYDYCSNGAYFVTLCTFDRICFFEEFIQLFELVERLWLDLPRRYDNLSLDEFILMPNHFHGIVTIKDDQPAGPANSNRAIGSIVGSFKSLCVNSWLAVLRSQGLNARGKFWQDNYFEHVIRNNEELGRIREYIRNNPLQWNLDPENRANCGKNAAMPEKWMV